jgi:hypothetical protein
MNLSNRQIFIISLVLILFGVLLRLIPHAPNATPISALAFAGSLYLGRRWAILLPLTALFLSDMTIGLYDWHIMLSVYGSFLFIGIWSWLSKKHNTPFSIALSVGSSSLFFFLVTNAAVWLFSPWYEKSIAGLMYTYELGLPFLKNMLAGDIIYTFALIGAFECFYYLRTNGVFFKKRFAKQF